jgi:DNA-binding MarR family transcriptional regulator/GNAT superfamily N-acetyltransferase
MLDAVKYLADAHRMSPAHAISATAVAADDIESVRAFNRFYTRQIGLLGKALHGSAYSLTEARVLYELAHRHNCTATELTRELGIDAGYLSRIFGRLQRSRLIERKRSASDRRESRVRLTELGRSAFEPLQSAARAQAGEMLRPMSPLQRRELVAAMRTVHRVLSPAPPAESPAPCTLRPLKAGDIGWITHRQALLYAEEFGWDASYEALVAEILAGFVKSFDPDAEQAFIAEAGGEIVGSVFLVRASAKLARLRLLYVEPHSRGLGIGRTLVNACIQAARTRGYQVLTLWTQDALAAARRIYKAAGFVLIRQEPHHSFGRDLTGETWELVL